MMVCRLLCKVLTAQARWQCGSPTRCPRGREVQRGAGSGWRSAAGTTIVDNRHSQATAVWGAVVLAAQVDSGEEMLLRQLATINLDIAEVRKRVVRSRCWHAPPLAQNANSA